MKVVLQRVSLASVVINGENKRSIGQGLLLLLGVAQGDTEADAEKLAQKCAELRIFEDENGKLNLSALQLGYSAMVVSNFTLQADTAKGRRPSFLHAAKPPESIELYNCFVKAISSQGLKEVVTGEFGADMKITLVNDGPITLVLDTEEWAAMNE